MPKLSERTKFILPIMITLVVSIFGGTLTIVSSTSALAERVDIIDQKQTSMNVIGRERDNSIQHNEITNARTSEMLEILVSSVKKLDETLDRVNDTVTRIDERNKYNKEK